MTRGARPDRWQWWRALPQRRAARRTPGPDARPTPSRLLPAIVLSCDRYHPFAAHMIARYDAVWPAHPFEFHVPYQERALEGRRVLPRKTGGAIRATVLELIEPLDDAAWIYWCIDDRYPIRLVQPTVQRLAEAVLDDRLAGMDGVLFCRQGNMWRPEHLLPDDRRDGPDGATLLGRRDYSQIWLHQFLRVKVLRHLFHRFPEAVPAAIVLDPLKHQVPLPADHRLYVVETNLSVFGESTSRGRVTRNCAASLRAMGIPLPPGFTAIDEDITMGVIERDGPPSSTRMGA
jgi:hypothetical protein